MAPNMDTMPATSQTSKIMCGEPSCAAMVAGFINILAPMMLPITIEVADQRPMVFFNAGDDIQWMVLLPVQPVLREPVHEYN